MNAARRRLHLIMLLVALTVISAACWGLWYAFIGRWPLAGDKRHDFGTVEILDESSVFTHTFTLRNRTEDEVLIQRAIASCGCTHVDVRERRLAPDETIEIPVELHLNAAGTKKAHITLMLADGTEEILFLKARGRKEVSLSIDQKTIRLSAGQAQPFIVMLRLAGSDAPPAPAVDVPLHVEASFEGWTLVTPADPETGSSNVWRGKGTLTWDGQSVTEAMNFSITVPGARTVTAGLATAAAP